MCSNSTLCQIAGPRAEARGLGRGNPGQPTEYTRRVLLLEQHARLLLVVHAILGALTVATTTHLVVWLRRRPSAAGVRWFAALAVGVYAAQFLLGNLLYPVYRVRVRAEYLEMPSAQEAHARADAEARAAIAGRAHAPAPPPAPPRDLSGFARLSDVKEHCVALGLPLAAGAFLLVRRGSGRAGALLTFCAAGAALCAWFGAIVGLVVTSIRAIG